MRHVHGAHLHASRVARAGVVLALLALAVASAPAAQAQSPAAAPAPAEGAGAPDALGRDTPLGTLTGFSRAVHRGELALATRYLQLRARSPREGEALAEDLSELLDRYFIRPLTTVSGEAAGSLDDGLAADREKLTLDVGGHEIDIFLVRTRETGQGDVWLVASDSLARIPALRRQEHASWVEARMPESLQRAPWLGATPAQWLLWAGSIVAPLALAWVVVAAAWAGAARVARRRGAGAALLPWRAVRRPLVLLVALAVHLSVMRVLGFSVTFRFQYTRAGLVLGVILLAVLAWHVLTASFERARIVASRRGRADARSLILLGERVVKVVVVVLACLVLLALAGVDTRTALAGVGIGGIALALGAQKTVENLLGGVFLLTDKALAVGDFCRIAGRLGWVEDVTLRSVRLRTLEQTLLSVPAGQLAQGSLENFSARPRMLMHHLLRLRHGATTAQLEDVIAKGRAALAEHPLVAQQDTRFRLVAYGPHGIELELFAYLATSELGEFLATQEQLLMRIATVVERAGAAFAQSTDRAASW